MNTSSTKHRAAAVGLACLVVVNASANLPTLVQIAALTAVGAQWAIAHCVRERELDEPLLVRLIRREEKLIRADQAACMGCLSQCSFSSWADNEKNSTGRLADPRSFCIQKTLQDIAHGGPVENNLMFAGHAAFRFKTDPFYSNGFVPTVKQLVDRILTGA